MVFPEYWPEVTSTFISIKGFGVLAYQQGSPSIVREKCIGICYFQQQNQATLYEEEHYFWKI